MTKTVWSTGAMLLLWLAPVAVAQGSPAARQPGSPLAQGEDVDRSLPPLQRPVTLTLLDVPLAEALHAIEQQADLRLGYTDRLLPAAGRVSLSVTAMPAAEALRRVLEGTGVMVREAPDGQLTLVRGVSPPRRVGGDTVGAIVGWVTAKETGSGLAGVVVEVKGTKLTAVTKASGIFTLAGVPAGPQTVTARLIGYRPAEQRIIVPDTGHTKLTFVLEMHTLRLQELVTTATGPQRRLELGNAITTIAADSILDAAPIDNLTELLDTRVPGLSVQSMSGVPGDPARLRLRGISSAHRMNDPIVIVDGVRVYSAQSDTRSGHLAAVSADEGILDDGPVEARIPAPSPLDQLDPNSIETVEVFNGPSAATLYGPDAANGVLVVTTKRGRSGPARWSASLTHGRSTMPGTYPEGYYRWGHAPDNSTPVICPTTDLRCVQDSLVRFQALNDPTLTPFGRGRRTDLSLTAAGGSETIQYSVTGTYGDETGVLRLPDFEVQQFRAERGTEPPGWMREPLSLREWNATSRVTARLSSSADVSLTTMLTRQEQQRSSLESQIGGMAVSYVDKASRRYYQPEHAASGLRMTQTGSPFSEYYRRSTATALNLTTGIGATWNPRPWFRASVNGGLNVINRDDQSLVPAGMRRSGSLGGDSVGVYARGVGRSLVSTLSLQTSARAPLWGFDLQASVGADLTSTTTDDLRNSARGLAPGANSFRGAAELESTEGRFGATSFGWYLQPAIARGHFFLSTAVRFDGGSTYGSRVELVGLPKVSASWLLSEESFFPLKGLFSTLRLRAAYGEAGVQPGPVDRLRLFELSQEWLDGGLGEAARLTTLGNTQLRPERSTEFEAGFDADFLDNRISMALTAYQKTQKDALMAVPLPPSVHGGGTLLRNIGVIRNTGLEISLGLTPVRSSGFTWSTQVQFSRNDNRVLELGPGVEPFFVGDGRVVAGYPLFGRWERPIIGYADANGDGVLQPGEVQVGDSLAFMGGLFPDYQTSLHTSLDLLDGSVAVRASFSYESGLTQQDQTASYSWVLDRAFADPGAPLGEQVATAASAQTEYGLIHSVSTFRFQSLSVRYRVPGGIARLFGAQQLSLAVQGSNLGLHSSYRGKDPEVSAWAPGEGVFDTGGQLPQPRDWRVRVDLQY